MRVVLTTLGMLPAIGPTSLWADDSVLFSDDFFKLDPAWGMASDQFHAENNPLVVQSPANRSTSTSA